MAIENTVKETWEYLANLKKERAEKFVRESEAIKEQRESFLNKYYQILENRELTKMERGRLLEDAKNSYLNTAFKAIYISALEAETLTDEGLALAESMVEKYIEENGGATKLMNRTSGRTYLLDCIYDKVIKEAESQLESIDKLNDEKVEEDESYGEVYNDYHTFEPIKEEGYDKRKSFGRVLGESPFGYKEIFSGALYEKDNGDNDSAGDSDSDSDDNDDKVDNNNDVDFDDDDESSKEAEINDSEESGGDEDESSEESEEDAADASDAEVSSDGDGNNDDSSTEETPNDSSEDGDAADDSSDETDKDSGDDLDTDSDESNGDDVNMDDDESSKDAETSDFDGSEEDAAESESPEDDDIDSDDDDDVVIDDEEDLNNAKEDEEDSEETTTKPPKGTDDEFLQDLDQEEDVKKAVELIRDRVADAEQDFIKRNAEDKKKIDELLGKISDNVKTVKDIADDESLDGSQSPNPDDEGEEKEDVQEKIAQETVQACKRMMHNITENKNFSVYEKFARNLSSSILKNKAVRESYIDGSSVNFGQIMETTRVMYGWLETVNTLQLEKVDEKYIKNVLDNIH